jgi:4a-hydroxytetrahydrobiopterin dehydratase
MLLLPILDYYGQSKINIIMKAFSNTEVKELLSATLKNWSFNGIKISRSFNFKTFVNAFSFMTAVALVAEKMDHHPDWSNIYNSVTIDLNTHDANGITRADFDLAQSIDRLFECYT